MWLEDRALLLMHDASSSTSAPTRPLTRGDPNAAMVIPGTIKIKNKSRAMVQLGRALTLHAEDSYLIPITPEDPLSPPEVTP